MRSTSLSTVALVVLAAACARDARADEPNLHFTAGVARATGGPQQTEFGAGGAGAVAREVPLGKMLGLEAELSGVALAQGRAPNPKVEPASVGLGVGAMLGVRVRPFGYLEDAGLFVDAHGGLVYTGDVVRPALDAHVGYDIRLGDSGVQLGPMIGFTKVVETSSSALPGDANLAWGGVHIAFGASAPKKPSPPVETGRAADPCADPTAPGCALADRDQDGIPDSDDACPNAAGRRTADAHTNGCAPPDRDHDLVFDDEDACPNVPGVRTGSAQTNGCPAPSKEEQAAQLERVMTTLSDVIHFDYDSPRVRPINRPVIQKVVDFVNSNPEITEIDIEGHADERGTELYNVELSRRRAEAVKAMLVELGVNTDRLVAHAYGKSRPRVVGHDEASFFENRRVEFVAVRSTIAADTRASDSQDSALNTGDER